MEDEKSILDATEYILMALNVIHTFEEFIEYKEEITKAIYDIRNSITNIMNMQNYNTNIEKAQKNVNPTSISSMLGLKFNYDAYLNNMKLNDFTQNEANFNNIINQGIQNSNSNLKYINDMNSSNNNNSVKNLLINSSQDNNRKNINIPKNILFSFKDDNINFESSQNNNDDNIINKSIRNKLKNSNNPLKNDINNINENEDEINININNNNNINPSLSNNYQIQKKEDINNKQKSINKKEKLGLIADIIMKINSEDYFYEILTKLFGDDLTDKLMSSEVSDNLLEAVQNSIKEIEELKKKDDIKNNNQNFNKQNAEEMEDRPKRFPIEQIMNPNIKQNININNKKINNENNNKDFNFEKKLRKSGEKKKEKPFISATSAYGNYFDPPLQKGGFSKLDEYKKP